jgi:hypothetical protein
MTVNYKKNSLDHQKVWNTMNELEMVTSKICSAREILDSAVDRLQEHQYDKVETLLCAADEFLQYYLQEFDIKFKDAWKETVVKINQPETELYCDKDDTSPECKSAWNNFWVEDYYTDKELDEMCDEAASEEKHSESYYDYTRNDSSRSNPFDKVVKWRLPVEEVEDGDTMETEYFIAFPDDLMEAANLNPGDEVEWVDQSDGSFLLRKVTKPLEMDKC